MCDKQAFRDPKDLIDKMNKQEKDMIPFPKTAYEILMAKRKRDKRIWFTDEKCEICGKDLITDGKVFWCSENCSQDGKMGKDDKNYMGFISDLIK